MVDSSKKDNSGTQKTNARNNSRQVQNNSNQQRNLRQTTEQEGVDFFPPKPGKIQRGVATGSVSSDYNVPTAQANLARLDPNAKVPPAFEKAFRAALQDAERVAPPSQGGTRMPNPNRGRG